MTDDLKRIVEKLDALRRADPKCLGFGTHIHRYRLAPPLSIAQLKSLEERYGVMLPPDYSEFLTEVGNGGAGPGYGLERFGFVHSTAEIPTAVPKGPLRVVQQTPGCTLSMKDLFDASGRKVDHFDVAFFDAIKALASDGQPGLDALKQPVLLSEPLRANEQPQKWADLYLWGGMFMLTDYGCAMSAFLILNGPFSGQVWLHDPNAECFVPFSETALLHYVDADAISELDAQTTFTFASWYEHWLDHAIVHARNEYESA